MKEPRKFRVKKNSADNQQRTSGIASGCLSWILSWILFFGLLLMVGLGGCVAYIYFGNMFNDWNTERKNKNYIIKIDKKIKNNKATAKDYFVYGAMISDYDAREILGMGDMSESGYRNLSYDYYKKAINQGNEQATIYYARDIYKYDWSSYDAIKSKEKALDLVEDVLIENCEIQIVNEYNLESPYFWKIEGGKEKEVDTFEYFAEEYWNDYFDEDTSDELMLLALYDTTQCRKPYIPQWEYSYFENIRDGKKIYWYAFENLTQTSFIPNAQDTVQMQKELALKERGLMLAIEFRKKFPNAVLTPWR